MLWTLIRHELLTNLMTFRFLVTVIADFLISADRADPDSPHVPFVREGMSDKPVSFESIPKFQDRVRLGDAFRGAALDVLLLVLLFVVLCGTAHVSLTRVFLSQFRATERLKSL